MTEHHLAHGTLSGHHEEHEHSEVRKLRHGFHIEKHHSDARRTEHAATDMDDAVNHVVDHLQDGNTAAQEPDQEAENASAPDEQGEEQPGEMA